MGGCVACERRNTVYFRAPEVNANINPSLRFSKFAATSSTDLGASRAMLQRRKARWTPSLVPDAARALRARRRSMRKRSTWREQGVRKNTHEVPDSKHENVGVAPRSMQARGGVIFNSTDSKLPLRRTKRGSRVRGKKCEMACTEKNNAYRSTSWKIGSICEPDPWC